MAKPLLHMMIITTASIWTLAGCDNRAEPDEQASQSVSQSAAQTDPQHAASQTTNTAAASPAAATTTVDWSSVASGEKPADRASYQYPFAQDSQNVRDYAEYFDVDNATAQYNLTVSMASNEALTRVLDQLNGSYVSHEVTDGDDMQLVIHTTPDVAASRYDYVLSDDFAKGLVLPIEIKPDGKKGDVTGHGEMTE